MIYTTTENEKKWEGIERFHMTSRRPYWCSKTMKRRPSWCSKQNLWELDSFLKWTIPFVLINLHICWPCEWKRTIQAMTHVVRWMSNVFEQTFLFYIATNCDFLREKFMNPHHRIPLLIRAVQQLLSVTKRYARKRFKWKLSKIACLIFKITNLAANTDFS